MNFEAILNDPLSILTYTFLTFSIIALWIDQKYKVWGSLLILSFVFGIIAERVQLVALFPIIGLAICFYITQKNRYSIALRISCGTIGVFLSFALAIHVIPGFENWKILDQFSFSSNSQPYSLFLNFDKPLVGLFILGFGPPLLMGKQAWFSMIRSMIPIFMMGFIVVSSLSYMMNYIEFDVKLPSIFLIWALKNLFFTCVAEEALFRGLLQRHLETALDSYKWGKIVSLITISILFGLVHFSGGIKYIILSTVAGVFYGYAFQKTKSIEASILTHFLLNTGHFIFFTYPALL